MMEYYVLKDKTPVHVPDVMTWARWFESADRHIANTNIGDVHISTVFLGLDHGYSELGPPLIFETMIFGGEHDQYQDRCSTYEEAEAMHKRAVALVNGE